MAGSAPGGIPETQRSPDVDVSGDIDQANERAVQLIFSADPVLVDVRPAADVIPGMDQRTVLTSGAPLSWDHYIGGQRDAVIGGVLFEGLASDPQAADRRIRAGEIRVAGCQDFGFVGSLAGVCTASMPVLVVEDRVSGNRAYCTLFEGASPAKLNYGVYNSATRENLRFLETVVGPLMGEAIRSCDGVSLRPLIRRALHMGDELHSRNTAATLLFTRDILLPLLSLASRGRNRVHELARYLSTSDYFFLRLSMAAAKVTADRVRDIRGSTVVSAMVFSCCEFAIRVAGLGDQWFRGLLPRMETGRLFDGHSEDEICFMGGESPMTEVIGLGAFAQAGAFALQSYQGGTPQRMVETNLEMYQITVAEHSEFKLPFLEYRGTPVGIDIRRVVQTGITPVMDIGIAGTGGGQIGAGCFRAPMQPFETALSALQTAASVPTPGEQTHYTYHDPTSPLATLHSQSARPLGKT